MYSTANKVKSLVNTIMLSKCKYVYKSVSILFFIILLMLDSFIYLHNGISLNNYSLIYLAGINIGILTSAYLFIKHYCHKVKTVVSDSIFKCEYNKCLEIQQAINSIKVEYKNALNSPILVISAANESITEYISNYEKNNNSKIDIDDIKDDLNAIQSSTDIINNYVNKENELIYLNDENSIYEILKSVIYIVNSHSYDVNLSYIIDRRLANYKIKEKYISHLLIYVLLVKINVKLGHTFLEINFKELEDNTGMLSFIFSHKVNNANNFAEFDVEILSEELHELITLNNITCYLSTEKQSDIVIHNVIIGILPKGGSYENR